jgi:hypothetical protein
LSERLRLKWIIGACCIVACGAIFSIWGYSLERRSPLAMSDLYPVYYHSRILMEHENPYIERPETYIRLRSEGYLDSKNIAFYGMPIIPCVYPPSSLIVVAPLALLRWGPAHVIWMALISVCLTLAGVLIWSVSFPDAPLLSTAIVGFVLVNSVTQLFEGNSGAIATGLCIIAAWCFMRRRLSFIGVICLAASLALKPHDSALVWLCFLLSGGIYRKRALQTLIPTALLVSMAIAWVAQVSPHWEHELAGNIVSLSSRGGNSDPGPQSQTNLIINSAINAQTVFAVLRDEPAFYNPASYTFCGVLLVLWFIATRRFPVTTARIWTSLAFFSALSMLPVYHRHHDSKLLMLAIPACLMLWTRHGMWGKFAILFTTLAIIFNSDIPRAILTNLEAGMAFSADTASGKLMMIFLARPAPLAIMAMAVFYLWAFWRVDFDLHSANGAVGASVDMVAHAAS